MNDVVNTIIKVERECSEMIDAARNGNENAINDLRVQIENKKKEEMKKIAAENSERYKSEVERAEGEMDNELAGMKKHLARLKENKELCDEVRARIISLILNEL